MEENPSVDVGSSRLAIASSGLIRKYGGRSVLLMRRL
jgi:hypothetical protein